MIKNKYSIGDSVRTKIHYENDRRTEADGVIIGIEIVENDVRYKLHFEPTDYEAKQGCTGATGYVNENDIILPLIQ